MIKASQSLRTGILVTLVLYFSCIRLNAQNNITITTDSLCRIGLENVRCGENENERVYTIENNVHKVNGIKIRKALEIIQSIGMPDNKDCRVIVTDYNVPQMSLKYENSRKNKYKKEILNVYKDSPNETNEDNESCIDLNDWKASYDLEGSWDIVRKAKRKNSSFFRTNLVIYPKLAYKNLIITQIYQALFTLCPTLEMSAWPGMKIIGQVKIPIYNDGYGDLEDKVHPEYITISQRFRLPYKIYGKVVVGLFNANRYGLDFRLMKPFSDERFSVEGRIGYTGLGYWDGFHYHYDSRKTLTWSLGANFYWPKYNTIFSLKGEQYLREDRGIRFDMIRHFRYASVGFYAVKGKDAKSNGGFTFIVNLGINRKKRHIFVPNIDIGDFGITYNAGNERYYYKGYNAESSDNIMRYNNFNPYFLKSEITNY